MKKLNSKICIVSGHYPSGVFFAEMTKDLLIKYSNINEYDLYYDSETEVDQITSELHFRRCLIIKKASEAFPEAEWYIWLDTDIYVKTLDKKIEDCIDLSNKNILYHLFHEKPWEFPINTGVKILSKNALHLEEEIYSKRINCTFPFEQKIISEEILPRHKDKIIIHDPEKLNCIYGLHDSENALFIHLCNRSELDRNLIILKNNKEVLKANKEVYSSKYNKYFYWFIIVNKIQKTNKVILLTKDLVIQGKIKIVMRGIISRLKKTYKYNKPN